MEDAAKTIAKLRRLAEGDGEEAKTAGEILKSLIAKHPDAAQLSETEPVKDVWFPARTWHDLAVMDHLCLYLGCDPFQKRGKPAAGIYMRGPASVVDAAPAIYKSLHQRLAELHKGTTIGFVLGALPLPKGEKKEPTSEPKKKDDLSEEALEAARAAMRIGQRAQPRRQLTGMGA